MIRPIAAALAATLAAGSAQAQDFQPKQAGMIVVNVRGTQVDPSGSDPVTTLAGAPTNLRAEADYDLMPTLGVTYFMSEHVAVEAIAGTTHHTVRAWAAATDVKVKKTWVLPPIVTLQYHFAPDAKISPYVGAGVNYMLFYGGDDKNGFRFRIKDGFGTALQLGVDVAANDPWQLNFDVKKVFFDTTAIDRTSGLKSKINLNPWVLSAGVGYRF